MKKPYLLVKRFDLVVLILYALKNASMVAEEETLDFAKQHGITADELEVQLDRMTNHDTA